MSDAIPSLRTQSRRPGRLIRGLGTTAIALCMLGAIATGTLALHLRAAADTTSTVETALPVETMIAHKSSAYAVERRFAGRLEPGRETDLAFERAGLVMEIAVEEGDRLAAGALIARMDIAPLLAEHDRLKAQRQATEADLALAQRTTQRQRGLADKGHASRQRYDEARFEAASLVARIAEIDAAIASLEIDIGKSDIVAPFAGVVAGRFIDDGRVVSPGTPVIRLLEDGKPRARIGVAPDTIGLLTPGATVTLDAGTIALEGRVSAVRTDLSTRTRTIPVLIDIPDRRSIPFGEVIDLVLKTETPADGFWVPLAALVEGRKGLWTVYTAKTDQAAGAIGVIEAKAVEIIHVADGQAYVRGTLVDGDRIVMTGTHRIIPGRRVQLAAVEG